MREYLRIAYKALRAHPFRSGLTVLSILIGTFSIVVMSSLAESGLRSLRKGVEELGGARILFLENKPAERAAKKAGASSNGMSKQEALQLFAALPHLVGHTLYGPLGRRDVRATATGTSARTDVVAADPGMMPMYRMKLAAGRRFDEHDDEQRRKVCVVGFKLAQTLWDGDALGQTLEVLGMHCRVIGVLADQKRWGVDMGFDWLDVVLAPYETLSETNPDLMQRPLLVMVTDDKQHNEAVKRILNALLVDWHHGVDDFQIFDVAKMMAGFDLVFDVMRAIVAAIASVALLVGGIGVMNIMLVSVSERVREIGIRKALGANPRDIAAQFLCESVVLSSAGGMLGTVLGMLVALIAGALISRLYPNWLTVIAYRAVALAWAVSIGVGVVFGMVPARRAGALPAIEAMRR